MATLGPRCSMWAFSSCEAKASPCSDASCSRARTLEHRLSSCGTRALLPCSIRTLPGPGTEPMSLALAGGFLTTGPLGRPTCFSKINYWRKKAKYIIMLKVVLNFPFLFFLGQSLFFKFFYVKHFWSLYWICYSIASVLCFDFLASRHVGSFSSPMRDQTQIPCTVSWNLNHWIIREVPMNISWKEI